MTDAVKTFVPMFAFMLIPVWIPMIAVAVGALFDAIANARGNRAGATPAIANARGNRAGATQ